MKRSLIVLVGLTIFATSAKADVDNFGLGNGLTPTPTLAAGPNFVNSYASITTVNAASVVVSSGTDAAAFAPANNGGRNVLALIWIAKQLPATEGTGSPFTIGPSTPNGSWELARVQSVATTTINFVNPLVTIAAGSPAPGDMQIVLVPEYASLAIATGQSIVPAKAWDGSSGGIVAMLVSGSISFTGSASINADGMGFRGGAQGGKFTSATHCDTDAEDTSNGSAGNRGENASSAAQGAGRKYLANGGGGGLCVDNGGGGGGHAGAGGGGDTDTGAATSPPGPFAGFGGGELDYSLLNHFEFGGGGGAGQIDSLTLDPGEASGAAGGGAVFIRAGSVTGGGSISADGNTAVHGSHPVGQGGGGAGGSIYLRVAGASSICGNVHANGGNGGGGGSNAGKGGGGGGGHTYVQASPSCAGAHADHGNSGGGTASDGNDGANDDVPLGPYCFGDANCALVSGRTVCNTSNNSCQQCSASETGACDHDHPVCTLGSCSAGCVDNTGCAAFPTFPICNTPGPGGTCGHCTSNAQCTDSTKPFCNTVGSGGDGSCQPCNGSGTNSGTCAAITSDAQSVCNTGTGACGTCSSSAQCGAAIGDPTKPFCTSGGACAACNATGSTATTCAVLTGNAKPVCNTGTGTCDVCATNSECGSTISDPDHPFCNTNGACDKCNGTGSSASTCSTITSNVDQVCNTSTGACEGCTTSSQCGSAIGNVDRPFCNGSNVCSACNASGSSASTCATITSDAKPVCNTGSGGCDVCTLSSQCGATISDPTKPFCDSNGACAGCGGAGSTSGTCAALTSNAKPVCSGTGACAVCTASNECGSAIGNANRPYCDTNGACAKCNGAGADATTCAVITGNADPVCDGTNGDCTVCTASSQCGATISDVNHPYCDSNGACAKCNGAGSTAGTCSTITSNADPVCTAAGACGLCTASSQCGSAAGNANTPFCNPVSGGGDGACKACNFQFGTSTNAQTCTAINANAPICDTVGGSCGACSTGLAGDTACQTINSRKPFCSGSGPCRACGSDSECNTDYASTPICITGGGQSGACGNCSSDSQCFSLNANKPICTASGCLACTGFADCEGDSPQTPVCVTTGPTTGSCQPCASDSDCAPQGAAGRPACEPDHSCGECSVTNSTQCTLDSGKPACNIDKSKCQLCTVGNADMGADSVGCATNSDGHACQGEDTEVFCGCTSDADCGNATSGRICDLNVKKCIAGCSRAPARNNCPAGQFCTSDDVSGDVPGVCTTTCNFNVDCTGAMSTMPFCISANGDGGVADGGNFGVSADGGVGRCAGCRDDGDCGGTTPVCEPSKKVCVQCTTTRLDQCLAAATGAACLSDETCGCLEDSDCGAVDSGRICDLTGNHQCKVGCRVVGGNGCPSGEICNGAGLVPGQCVTPNDLAMNIPDAGPENVDMSVPMDMTQTGFKLRGGGFGCDVGAEANGTSLGALLLVGLALVSLRLRRRRVR